MSQSSLVIIGDSTSLSKFLPKQKISLESTHIDFAWMHFIEKPPNYPLGPFMPNQTHLIWIPSYHRCQPLIWIANSNSKLIEVINQNFPQFEYFEFHLIWSLLISKYFYLAYQFQIKRDPPINTTSNNVSTFGKAKFRVHVNCADIPEVFFKFWFPNSGTGFILFGNLVQLCCSLLSKWCW